MTAALALAAAAGPAAGPASWHGHAHTQAGPAFRITAPLGRTGLPGTLRIVARLDGDVTAAAVRFFVDGTLLATDTDGPPYDALWSDDNPFEARELRAEADLPGGSTLTDRVALKPLEVTEAAEVTSIGVEASVLDARGRFVTGLAPQDFSLFEDGEAQQLDQVTQQREPALFALLVDSSQSMAMRVDAVRAAAVQLLKPLDKQDQVVVAPFSRRILTVTGPTADRATVLDAISAIRPGGGTAILDALAEAAGTLARDERRKAIVLITDGYDEHSQSAFDAAVAALRTNKLAVYVVGFGGVAGISLKGEALLSKLADDTGGRAWFPRDERQLEVAYESIARDVQQRYFLTYTPRNQRRDGSWREIDVKVTTTKVLVRARKGYTAPVAPPVRVSLEFTATSTDAAPVALSLDDLEVSEDGVPQRVDTFHEAVLPVTFMLALDASGSMKRSAGAAQQAAREFIAAMRPEDDLGMILFADKANYIGSPGRRREVSLGAIDGYVAAGGTALNDALHDSLAQIAGVPGRRVVVVVTDGRDENAASNGPGSLRTWDEVLTQLQKTDAAVYAIGLGSNVDKARLRQIADRSGGAAYFPSDVSTLADEFGRILDELRRRYVVGYESTNRMRNGEWRTVEIHAGQGGVSVRSRGGYYAPPQ